MPKSTILPKIAFFAKVRLLKKIPPQKRGDDDVIVFS